MVPRVLAALVALLLCPAVLAAPAGAHHGDAPDVPQDADGGWWDDDGSTDEDAVDGGFDEGADPDREPATPVPPVASPQPDEDPVTDDPYLDPRFPVLPEIEVPKGKTVAGTVALVRADGKAAIPRGAPKRVRALISAANQIVGKPYTWGGGHARLVDRGYDCSGAVSYALIRTGMLRAPLVSGRLARWGSAGAGRWISVHANRGHVYLEVAGLRLDTSPIGDRGGRKGVRWRPAIGRRPGFTTRHPVGL